MNGTDYQLAASPNKVFELNIVFTNVVEMQGFSVSICSDFPDSIITVQIAGNRCIALVSDMDYDV